LVSVPAGSTLNEASYDGGTFTNGVTFTPPFPNVTLITFQGPPGILAGDTTQIGIGFVINASGPQTVEIVLTPAAVPEPSTLTLGLIGAIASVGYCARRSRRQR
jgi:PEP-CTERM motif